MDDDIDIEEHDVWENPRLRSIFPDLAKVKTEVPDFKEYSDQDEDYYYYQQDGVGIHNEANTLNMETDHEIPSETFESINEYPIFGNKIILGTKKCTTSNDEFLDSDNKQLMNDPKLQILEPILFLDDWGSILENNICYCKECKILYPTENAFDAHKMIAHSFLVAMDCLPSNKAKKSTTLNVDFIVKRNTAFKSTAKHPYAHTNKGVIKSDSHDQEQTPCPFCEIVWSSRSNTRQHCLSVHKINLVQWENKNNKPSLCNHCNKYFANDAALIKHLYEMLPMKEDISDAVDVNIIKPAPIIEQNKEEAVPKFCHQCPICFCYFITKIQFHIHAFKNHSVKNLTAIYSKYKALCGICNAVVRLPYQSRHMRTYHMGILYKNGSKLNKKTSCRFKCLKCSRTFDDSVSASIHRKSHVDLPYIKLIVKMKANQKEQAEKKEELNMLSKEPIPKSVLFNCKKCLLHFYSFSQTMIHVRSCHKVLEDATTCQKCNLLIDNGSLEYHKTQHKITTKFKVYSYDVQMMRKLLCKCSNCDLWYHRASFLKHFFGNCSKTLVRKKCPECNIYFTMSGLKYHRKTHTEFIRSDSSNKCGFIKVEYFPFVSRIKKLVAVKRKLEDHPNETPSKRRNYLNDILMKKKPYEIFYCNICKRCALLNKINHSDGRCRTKQYKRKVCKACGIAFSERSYISHQQMHNMDKNLNLCDFKVTCIQKPNASVLPVPAYYTCKKCHVYFKNGKKCMFHRCGGESYICTHCNKKFDHDTYTGHIALHKKNGRSIDAKAGSFHKHNNSAKTFVKKTESHVKYNNRIETLDETPESHEEHNINTETFDEKAESLENYNRMATFDEKMELLEKYNSMKTIWDVLYLCEDCNVVTVSYDKVVEHSQNHIADARETHWPIERCNICRLNFNKTCYTNHKELHSGIVETNKSTFKILKFSFDDLLSESWLDLFDLVDDEKKEQILSRSIYNVTRSVRMELIQDGDPNITLYKCYRCQCVVDPESIQNHITYGNCDTKDKNDIFNCSICNINFISEINSKKHKQIHMNETDVWFKIISFNNINHGTINKAINEYVAEINNKSVDNVSDVNDKTVSSFTFYKCTNCGVYLRQETSTYGHRCGVVNKVTCHKCDILLSCTNIDRHRADHKKYKDLNKNNIFTINFSPYKLKISKEPEIEGNNTDDQVSISSCDATTNSTEPRLYRCECGLHYLCMKSIKRHLELCNSKYNIAKEKCSKCGLLFSTKSLVNHLCRHHSNGDTKLEIEDVIVDRNEITDRLYRCGICDTIFHHSISVSKHLQHCNGNSGFVNCSKCRLKIYCREKVMHEKLHESGANVDDFTFVTKDTPAKYTTFVFTNNKDYKTDIRLEAENEAGVVYNLIYTCEKCDLCYLTAESLRTHQIKRNHVSMIQTVKCDHCPLKFTEKSVKQHMIKHHKVKTKRPLKIITIDFNASRSNEQYMDISNGRDEENKDTNELNNIRTLPVAVDNEVDPIEESSINVEDHNDNDIAEVEIKNGEKTEDSDYSSFDEVETKNLFPCNVCKKKYKTGRELHVHVSLDHDHSDAAKCCSICGDKYNDPILSDAHLQIGDDTFVCCVCQQRLRTEQLEEHANIHRPVTIS